MAEISSATVELVEPVNHTLLEFWFQGYSFAENGKHEKNPRTQECFGEEMCDIHTASVFSQVHRRREN